MLICFSAFSYKVKSEVEGKSFFRRTPQEFHCGEEDASLGFRHLSSRSRQRYEELTEEVLEVTVTLKDHFRDHYTLGFADWVLRGNGQVVFQNNPISSAVILGGNLLQLLD